VLGDAAYGTCDLRQRLQAGGHATVIKPPPLQVIPGGLTVDDQAGTATCPVGHAVALAAPSRQNPAGPVQGPVPRLPDE
jgi:hypothetical protein